MMVVRFLGFRHTRSGMKQDTHPAYFANATVICNGCGTTYTVGSTKENVTVELCSNCHPFYTGKQKLVDTAGRVDRYRARAAKAATSKLASEPAKPAPSKDDAPSPEERLASMKASLENDASPEQ